MATPWDPNLPIEYIFRQIQDAMDYADHAKTPFSMEQIVNEAYILVFNTGLFENKCRKWRKRTTNMSWVDFKKYVGEAYNDWREAKNTTAAANYATANMLTNNRVFEDENIAAIANLATVTAADRATKAKLTATNAQLTINLKKTQDILVDALESLERLSKPTMYTCNTGHNTPFTQNQDAILDSGCSYHTLRQDAPSEHRKSAQNIQLCGTPTGNMMTASDFALIKHKDFPTKSRTAHHYPDLKYKSLLSVGQFCDSGYATVFKSKDAKVIDENTNEVLLIKIRKQPPGLWVTPMDQLKALQICTT